MSTNKKEKKGVVLPGDNIVTSGAVSPPKNSPVRVSRGSGKHSGLALLRDGVSGVAGAYVGSALGRPSLLVGLATTFGGHYAGSQAVASFGLGMVLANGFSSSEGGQDNLGKSPTGKFHMKTEVKNAKTRMSNFSSQFKKKLYLDKLLKKKGKAPEEVSGDDLGAVKLSPGEGWDRLRLQELANQEAARHMSPQHMLPEMVAEPAPLYSEADDFAEPVESENLNRHGRHL